MDSIARQQTPKQVGQNTAIPLERLVLLLNVIVALGVESTTVLEVTVRCCFFATDQMVVPAMTRNVSIMTGEEIMNEGNQVELSRREQIEGSWPPVDALVISVRQPWAWLIINAGKDIENRDWFTKVRGRVLIHASKGITKREWAEAWEAVRHLCPEAWEKGKREIQAGMIERGGIIGSVEIVDCVERSDSPWFFGRYGFVLKDPQPLPFQPCKGQLGFFRI